MASKKKYVKKSFESDGSSSDTSANVYVSMMTSPAFESLTARQARLYFAMKGEYYGAKPKNRPDPEDTTKFYFNKALWQEKYRLYSTANERRFPEDVDALVLHGFIRVVSSGRASRTRSVYQFWDMWQKWGTPEFHVHAADRPARNRIIEEAIHKQAAGDS